MNFAFNIKDMVKSYKDFKPGPINLDLKPGHVCGLVGPNGAGKTTLLNCLSGLIIPERGSISIVDRPLDLNDQSWKHEVGYVVDEQNFYENWTGARNLNFISKFYPSWSQSFADELVKRLECPIKKKASKMSKGNRVKLSLISVLARKPKLLLLDEPTAGLDPLIRAELLETLWELLADENQTIFYSTHNISDLGTMADEIVFIRDGIIKRRSDKDDLTNVWRKITFRSTNSKLALPGVIDYKIDGNDHLVISENCDSTLESLKTHEVEDIKSNRLGLDEIVVWVLRKEKS